MEVIKLVEEAAGEKIVSILRQGKIVVYPTDTIYGLGCDATDARAVKKIYQIKQRDTNRPLLILLPDLKAVKKYCLVDARQNKILQDIWPQNPLSLTNKKFRPTSIILRRKSSLPAIFAAGGDSVAVRVSDNVFLQAILAKFKKPLVSTSVNLSGDPPLSSPQKIIKIFKDQVDLLVDGGEAPRSRPSRLLDLRDPDHILILRK